MADQTVCLFSTIRAPLEDTLDFAYYHLNSGIDHIYIFFDNPDDPALDILKPENRISCIRCDSDYWAKYIGNHPKSDLSINLKQEINSRIAIKRSREDGFSWICHVDSDELIHAPGGFRKVIAAIPPTVQVAKFPVLEVIPEKLSIQSAFHELHNFKIAPVTLPRNKSLYLDPQEVYTFYKNDILYRTKIFRAIILGSASARVDYIKGHSLGKSIARTNAPFDLFRSHFPTPHKNKRLKMNLISEIKLLHYDSPDFDRWKTKWHIRYRNIQNGIIPMKLSDRRRKQYELFSSVFENGNEEDLVVLFKSNFFISPSEREVLLKTGLVTEVHLPEESFASTRGSLNLY